ncbi:MAG: hypothetical protein AAF357_00300 [Verrucomicrobiota bacterium]
MSGYRDICRDIEGEEAEAEAELTTSANFAARIEEFDTAFVHRFKDPKKRNGSFITSEDLITLINE